MSAPFAARLVLFNNLRFFSSFQIYQIKPSKPYLSLPTRLQQQIRFLFDHQASLCVLSHPILIGCQVSVIYYNCKSYKKPHKKGSEGTKRFHWFSIQVLYGHHTAIFHPKEILEIFKILGFNVESRSWRKSKGTQLLQFPFCLFDTRNVHIKDLFWAKLIKLV